MKSANNTTVRGSCNIHLLYIFMARRAKPMIAFPRVICYSYRIRARSITEI